jgi:hypothetical protein
VISKQRQHKFLYEAVWEKYIIAKEKQQGDMVGVKFMRRHRDKTR